MKRQKIKFPYEFDPKRRKLAKVYSKRKLITGIINGIVIELSFIALFLYLGYNLALGGALAGLGALAIPAYIFVFATLLTAVSFPISFWSSYVYDKKHGLVVQPLRGWLKDFFKSLALGYIFTIPVFTGLYLLLPVQNWWIYAGIIYFFLAAALNYIFPTVIFPWFYKTAPYRDRAQIAKLKALCGKAGVSVSKVLVAKESEKSVRANAMFAGFGRTKRIVLFDTLLDKFAPPEVETVVAHELGHYVNRDIWRGLAMDAVKIFPVLFVMDYVLRASVGSFGISGMGDIASLPLFLLAYSLIGLAMMPLANTYWRHREARADYFAISSTRKPEANASTDRRLADIDLGDDDPHPAIEFIFENHPSIKKRIAMAERWKKEHAGKSRKSDYDMT